MKAQSYNLSFRVPLVLHKEFNLWANIFANLIEKTKLFQKIERHSFQSHCSIPREVFSLSMPYDKKAWKRFRKEKLPMLQNFFSGQLKQNGLSSDLIFFDGSFKTYSELE